MSTPTNIPETPMGGTVPDSFLESKEKFYLQLQNIFQTILRVNNPDQFDQLCQWMEYKQFHTFDDFYDFYRDCSEKLDAKNPEAEYKWKGKTNHLSANVAHKLKSFVQWMAHENKPHDLHDDYLASLTRENYFNFRFLCTQSPLTLPPSHHESQQLMTSFPSEFKQPTQSETKTALNNFKKGTKRDASVYPIFKNDKYYDTFQRSFFANLKAQGLYDVADPDYDTESGDIYEQELFQGKQSFVYSVLVTSLQTEKGRELVKEFEGDARSIILKLHHYHTKSNVAQHDIITLTTDITNLTLNDSWKGTVRQFLSHFKEKLRLLDSLVSVSDQLPETTRITFLHKAEQRYGVVKRYINTLMNLTGAPAHCWLLCMLYVCSLLNATASPALGGITPLQALTGQVPDISHFLHFSFWEPIYYKVDETEPDHRFPSQSNEKRGHWVGFADNKGDHLTWKILTDDTNTIIIRSAVRSATKTSPNLRLDPPEGEDPSDLTSDVFVYGRPNPDGSDHTPPMSIINFDDLLGRTFLLPMDENGERKRATISEHVKDLYQDQVSREDQLRFKLKIDGDQLDDLISYNQLMEYLEDKTDNGPLEDGLYRFKSIKDHKGPYTSSDPEYNGSSYNLLIEWETGEHTWEPLSNIIASDPYTCAIYAKEHDLLNTPGWKLLKRHARTARRLIRTLKKSKYRQAKASKKYKHGWEVPRDYAHALQLDIQNGNNKWKDAIDLEIEQIKEYQVFKDYGKAVYEKNKITNAPEGHQKIRVHFVFDVKHCGKFKARLVADGHLTKEPMETVYSGVVSIRNLRLAMFLAELNDLELWGADVGNAYLQALTKEKLYIVGGPEFEALQGHVLVMYKALYGTRSGGACWHDKFFDILNDMGFKPSKADPDIWMKPSKDGSHYEYIAVYVDDLAICMKDPKAFCDTLKEKYKLKLKGVGPINYHLGCGYTRDEDGTLVADPRKYVEKILESYEKTFGEKPKKSKTPLVGGDHPESDTSEFCNQDQIKQYQTIVGQLIWLSGLGRFDIAVHVMTMSRFRQQPRIGHLERLKKIVGYLANLPHGALRFRLHEPDYSNLPHKEYDWQRTVYSGAKEEIPHDIPEPKGKHVTTSTYVDANLHHDQVTGKAVTACLHMVNATPSHWHTKRQATVETATFGSEFVAARIATDQIIDLRYTLMYLGVPVRSKSYMFGDNKSVVDSASIPTSTLSKKSTLASYHRVREAIAAGYIQFNWKDGKSNPADILSKHWEFASIWPLLKPLLFWKGDTNELNAKAKGSDRIPVKKKLV